MFPDTSKLFILTVVLSSVTIYPSLARKRVIIIQDRSNSSLIAISQDDPEEYRLREYNKTEQWMNTTKENKKRIQKHARGEL